MRAPGRQRRGFGDAPGREGFEIERRLLGGGALSQLARLGVLGAGSGSLLGGPLAREGVLAPGFGRAPGGLASAAVL